MTPPPTPPSPGAAGAPGSADAPPDDLRALMARLPQVGQVAWIGLRPARRAPLASVDAVEALAGRGLSGDRAASRPRTGGKRQVTLIQAEHLPVVAALVGWRQLDPAVLRRNIVVSGLNLTALRGLRFQVGAAVLEGTGPCDPCSRMEEALGPGGYGAMRGHGGITAMVVTSGRIQVGDPVRSLGWPS